MLCNSNNGMFLETLLNRTSDYYLQNHKLLFFKRNLPITIYKNNNGNIIGKLTNKSQTDYYGVYEGRYIDFEAKQTSKDVFYLKNIKQHQLDHLKIINEINGISFLVLYFLKFDEFFCIDYEKLITAKSKLTREWCKNNGFEIFLFFPGILNIIPYLKNKI